MKPIESMNIKYPLLIDGGLSNVLEAQGCQLDHRLWSAKMLISNPEAIKQAHITYLEAGARCITTSSYQATIGGFESLGYSREEAESYIVRSVSLAESAVEQYMASKRINKKPFIAASIGPYGAFLANGSEYLGNYGLSDQQLDDFHRPRIELLDGTAADWIACETIPDFKEARVLGDILLKTEKQAWLSFSCKDDKHLNDGTPIRECAEYFSGHPNIFALGVNCTAPKYITGLVKMLKQKCGSKHIVVYPNSGEAYHVESKSWIGLSDPGSFVEMSREWLLMGADIVGGCCRIGPSHIKSLNRTILMNQ